MAKRSIIALLVSAFACAILNAEELPLIHQPTLTPQDSGTINGLIAVWPVNHRWSGPAVATVHSQSPPMAGRLGMPMLWPVLKIWNSEIFKASAPALRIYC